MWRCPGGSGSDHLEALEGFPVGASRANPCRAFAFQRFLRWASRRHLRVRSPTPAGPTQERSLRLKCGGRQTHGGLPCPGPRNSQDTRAGICEVPLPSGGGLRAAEDVGSRFESAPLGIGIARTGLPHGFSESGVGEARRGPQAQRGSWGRVCGDLRVVGSGCARTKRPCQSFVAGSSAGGAATHVRTWAAGHTELNDGTNARATSLSSAGVPPPLALASWEPGRRDAAGLHFAERPLGVSWILAHACAAWSHLGPDRAHASPGRLSQARGLVAGTVCRRAARGRLDQRLCGLARRGSRPLQR
jgi:hypothetical protein